MKEKGRGRGREETWRGIRKSLGDPFVWTGLGPKLKKGPSYFLKELEIAILTFPIHTVIRSLQNRA